MIRYMTAGESHGEALTAVIDGLPAGVGITASYINRELRRRQQGYGRGRRMTIEADEVRILSGVRWGFTTGAPVSLLVKNRDWANWKDIMSADAARDPKAMLTRPRPGHADLPGILKYNLDDLRDVSERASARETAARVAAGAVCRKFIEDLGIRVFSYVEEIAGVRSSVIFDGTPKMTQAVEKSPVRCPDREAAAFMMKAIDTASAAGDSAGGIFAVIISGVPAGLGSHTQWDLKLDAALARCLVSIQGVKGVEFGAGFRLSALPGSKAQDEIFRGRTGYFRKTNNAGGLEGGISNGEDIVMRAVMKPIPSLKKPLKSVDIRTGKAVTANIIRADVCAVPACGIVAENAAAVEIANALREKLGGDNMAEIIHRHKAYLAYLKRS